MPAEWPTEVVRRAESLHMELCADIDRFVDWHQLPEFFRPLVEHYYLPLALWLSDCKRQQHTLVVGICGGQGSGKSTLAEFLHLAWEYLGLRSAGFSLDDIYLTRAQRAQLAADVHPLLATRGVPGTHDIPLGMDIIDRLCGLGGPGPVSLPMFDKGADDRRPRSLWPVQSVPVDILLLEGWCVGARPWRGGEAPINTLEQHEDSDGSWRNFINKQLRGPYRDLFARLDRLVMLKVPDMDSVLDWRSLQEQKLRARGGKGMRADEIGRFIQYYERITFNMLAEMPQRADCVLELGRDHSICGVRLNPGPPGDRVEKQKTRR
ncbi:phosphoribulokinase [Microbulbifer sp. TYP-18]|uniref:phosphoribulokinase n=1 Tax=Microbulbifer sp. TYP-18 TaxID=3230024 RepID=UPI0034C5C1EF